MFAGGRGPRHRSGGVGVSGRVVHDIVLSGTNLTDEEARSPTSYLTEFAPPPGREVRPTYQPSF